MRNASQKPLCFRLVKMSQNLKKTQNFLLLLLLTEIAQARALLETVTTKQTDALVEIVYNLMNIATTKSDKSVIRKRRSFLRKLIDRKTKVTAKKKLIARHRVKLLKTLLHFQKPLLSLLK